MSLDLAPRQRAMLEEMGVKVWWPAAEVAAPIAVLPAAAAVVRPAAITLSVVAPEFIASTAYPISDEGNFDTGKTVKQPPAVAWLSAPRASATPFTAPLTSHQAAHLDWPALQDAVASCQACGLCASRKNTVFGVGQAPTEPALAPQVDWLIVGEAPGENEDLQGEPFVGQAGKLLDNMLKALGLNRTGQVYITNVLKCRPPHNRNPTPAEISQCAPYLQRQIELLQPKIILALGRFAVQTLLADSVPQVATIPLGKLRGQVYVYHGVPVVVSYHPAYLLRSLPDKAKAWADLCLAQSVVRKAG